MKLYVEAIEEIPEGIGMDYIPEFYQVEVVGEDIERALTELKSKLDPNKKYMIRKHWCRHDEGEACEIEEL
jgi:hypothetical protein